MKLETSSFIRCMDTVYKLRNIAALVMICLLLSDCSSSEGYIFNTIFPPEYVVVNVANDASGLSDGSAGSVLPGFFFQSEGLAFLRETPPSTYPLFISPKNNTTATIYPAVISTQIQPPAPGLDTRYLVEYVLETESELVALTTNNNGHGVLSFNSEVSVQDNVTIALMLTPDPDNPDSVALESVTVYIQFELYPVTADPRAETSGTGLPNPLMNSYLYLASDVVVGNYSKFQSGGAEATTIFDLSGFNGMVSDYGVIIGADVAELDTSTMFELAANIFNYGMEVVDDANYTLEYRVFLEDFFRTPLSNLGVTVPADDEYDSSGTISDSLTLKHGKDYFVQVEVYKNGTRSADASPVLFYNYGVSVAASPELAEVVLTDSSGKRRTLSNNGIEQRVSTNAGEYNLHLKGAGDFYLVAEDNSHIALQAVSGGDAAERMTTLNFTTAGDHRYKVFTMIESSLTEKNAECQAIKEQYLVYADADDNAVSLWDINAPQCYFYIIQAQPYNFKVL